MALAAGDEGHQIFRVHRRVVAQAGGATSSFGTPQICGDFLQSVGRMSLTAAVAIQSRCGLRIRAGNAPRHGSRGTVQA